MRVFMTKWELLSRKEQDWKQKFFFLFVYLPFVSQSTQYLLSSSLNNSFRMLEHRS